ncbi:MAG: GNAT family N-acetyltransferase, partial [Eubacteriales bacterium]
CSLDMLTAASSIDMPSAIRLTPDLDFPPDFSDIALGLTMGCEAYGVVERKSVLSAAYTFVPTSYLGDPLDGIEIGVETIENKRGRGYATAAVRALAADLTGRGFRVLFSYYTDNEPSRRIADAIGFCCHAVGFEIVLKGRNTHAL